MNAIETVLSELKARRESIDQAICALERCYPAANYDQPAKAQEFPAEESRISMASKKCKKCAKTKPIDKFAAHKQCSDGHSGTCKECINARARARFAARRKKQGIPPAGGKTFLCESCHATFLSKDIFEQHVAERHPEQSKAGHFGCNECEKIFADQNALSIHKAKRHS